MKKLFLVILIITLPLIAYFQYQNYRRFHPPTSYDYPIADSLDMYYHDASMVQEYFEKAISVGAFARRMWFSEKIDVRFPHADSEMALNAFKFYNQTLSRLAYLEKSLQTSASFKKLGFNNEDIRLMESGVSGQNVYFHKNAHRYENLKIGDQGQQVWLVQKRLIEKGYKHELDGEFGIDTKEAIKAFQNDNNLYPSGDMDVETLLVFLSD